MSKDRKLLQELNKNIIRNTAGILLSIHILTQATYYPDKGILAAFYIFIFLIAIHYGRFLIEYQDHLLAGIRWSAIISIPAAFLVMPPDAVGIPGLIGQKNLFANWIACGMAASFSHPLLFAILAIALVFSASKTAIFYLIILWIAYVFYNRKA